MKPLPQTVQRRLSDCAAQYQSLRETISVCILRGPAAVPLTDRTAAVDTLTRLASDHSITHSPYVAAGRLPLRRLRKSLGLTQQELAERVGVSRRSIYSYEISGRIPRVETARALARLFGLDPLVTIDLCGAHRHGGARRTRARLAATITDATVPLIGPGLRAARETAGLSQREMARQIGVHRKTWQGYELGHFRPVDWRSFKTRVQEVLQANNACR
jgi:DNA-binding XRE family transcriptional regulator